ncbi:MAG TPA: phenylalanine--tRNA ligase subunit beta, partial [Gaiellaceae bacterium]|nr:phenylalanine--tRNA ligase subunit beta [Gaiellaceae bacterium]
MKVPVSWLREYVDLPLPVEELARRLVFTSVEVDRVVQRGVVDVDGNLGRFRVARVLEAGKHPNADRLQLCQVDVGEGESRQIVCGAWNFGAGATVAVALPGALLPGAAQPLGEAKLRGEVSRGMILSERELELGADHGGIMLLEDGLEPGTPLADVLPLTETVLELETGFNRPDLTSVYGIAREVAAVTGAELAPQPGSVTSEPLPGDTMDVRVEDVGGCPRYVGRLFRGVRVGESPPWLKARLLAAGMRPISNVVDVTNYVMLALGNPLHAFDHATLAGGRVVVRRALPGEELVTLDGQPRRLAPTDLMIADAERSVAIAGIMGGEETEVREQSTDVLLEAANFDALTVLRSARRLHMRTEGSTRWEKGVDPHLAGAAANHATELLIELTGGSWTAGVDVQGSLPPRPLVRLRPELAERLVGMPFPRAEQERTLQRLGFEVDGDDVRVPTWRARDVTRPVDLVEEVARFRMEDVPATMPERVAVSAQLTREQRLRRQVEDVLAGAGCHEAYTWTLVPATEGRIPLQEPYTVELAALRTDLVHGLLESAERNRDVGVERISLFELARVFLPVAGERLPDEPWHAGVITNGGFTAAKGVVETLYRTLHVDPAFAAGEGREARTPEGAVREFDGIWGYAELDLDALFARVPDIVVYEDVITYPALKQDLAFVLDVGVPSAEVFAAARAAAAPELRSLRFLSDFREPPIPPGKKSLAFSVEFRSAERTLSDGDAV